VGSPKPATGAWYALAAIFKTQRDEYGNWERIVTADGGLACPVCGEPLTSGPSTPAGAEVVRFCEFAGDHQFRVPRDVVPPREGQRMGRYG
jgi:hypothetical protein